MLAYLLLLAAVALGLFAAFRLSGVRSARRRAARRETAHIFISTTKQDD